MPKMKSNRALAKRIKVTGTGKIKIKHAYMGHLAPNKSHKQKKHLTKRGTLHKSDVKRVYQMIDSKNR